MSNTSDVKITVHWLNKSRGHRIIWLLEELKLNYEVKVYLRDQNKRAPPELKKIHPLGKSPAIEIAAPGLEKPLVLAESGAIVEYLCEHFGQETIPKRYPQGKEGMVGAETPEWVLNRYFMHYAEGSLMPQLLVGIIVSGIRNAPVPFFIKPIVRKIADTVDASYLKPELKNQFDFLEETMNKAPSGRFLCGDKPSPSDFMMIFPLEAAMTRSSLLTETAYPKLYNYVRNIQSLEAYKNAGKRVEEASGEKFVPFSEAKF